MYVYASTYHVFSNHDMVVEADEMKTGTRYSQLSLQF